MVTKSNLNATLRAMKPGQVELIPLRLRRYSSILSAAATIGKEMGRSFSVSVDWTLGQAKVVRNN